MAIGTAAAILGGSVLSAGASALGASSASKAATKAANQNAQLLQQQYNQTRSDLQPYTQYGYSAGNALSDRLFGPQQGEADWGAYLSQNPDVAARVREQVAAGDYASEAEAAAAHAQSSGIAEGRVVPTFNAGPELDFMSMERPDYGASPTFGQAPGFYMDPNPSQRYKDELADSTKSINARSGATQGYFSGGRAKALQGNANKLWAADEDRRWQQAMGQYQSALSQYNQDRASALNQFNTDRSVGNQLFDSDRGFGAGRYDTTTNNLFNLLGIGANATQSLAGYGQQNANALAANNNARAGAQGNAAISMSNSIGNALGQAAMGLGSIYGGGGGYGAQGSSLPSSYQVAPLPAYKWQGLGLG